MLKERMIVPDVLSTSVIFIYIIPFILYLFTGNFIHIKALLGIVGTTAISESLKFFIIGKTSSRPQGAKDCNLLCNDGNQSGKPGMPSSHSASTAFFSGFYIQQTDNKIIKGLLIIYTGLVMLSRYMKSCHTINQIVVGAILGASLSWLVVRHL
jgi:membrane-associated phospholipid phosphatase